MADNCIRFKLLPWKYISLVIDTYLHITKLADSCTRLRFLQWNLFLLVIYLPFNKYKS